MLKALYTRYNGSTRAFSSLEEGGLKRNSSRDFLRRASRRDWMPVGKREKTIVFGTCIVLIVFVLLLILPSQSQDDDLSRGKLRSFRRGSSEDALDNHLSNYAVSETLSSLKDLVIVNGTYELDIFTGSY